MVSRHTHLRPHHLRERGDELRRRVQILRNDLFVDHLPDGIPQRLRESLYLISQKLPSLKHQDPYLLALVGLCVRHGELI